MQHNTKDERKLHRTKTRVQIMPPQRYMVRIYLDKWMILFLVFFTRQVPWQFHKSLPLLKLSYIITSVCLIANCYNCSSYLMCYKGPFLKPFARIWYAVIGNRMSTSYTEPKYKHTISTTTVEEAKWTSLFPFFSNTFNAFTEQSV